MSIASSWTADSDVLGNVVQSARDNSIRRKFLSAIWENSFQVNRNKNKFLTIFVVIVELFGIWSLAFSPIGGDTFGDAGEYLKYLSLSRIVWTKTLLPVFHIIGYAYMLILTVLVIIVHKKISDGSEANSKIVILYSHVYSIFPALQIPLFGIFLSISCDVSSNFLKFYPDEECGNLKGILLTSFGLFFFLYACFVASLSPITFEWIPSSSFFSNICSRFQIWILALKVIAVAFDSLQQGISDKMANSIYGAVLTLGNAAILIYLLFYLPFHRKTVNLVYCGFFAFSIGTSLVRFVAAVSGGGLPFLFVLVPISLAFMIVGVLVARWRLKKLTKLAKSFNANDKIPFIRDFEVEIATRFVLFSSSQKEEEEVGLLFNVAIDTLPQSPIVRLAYAIFLSTKNEDTHILSSVMKRTLRLKPATDFEYILFSLETRRRKILLQQDGGSEEIDRKLVEAQKYQDKCKKFIKSFWNSLLQEDLNNLPDIVASIETSEYRSNVILQKLVEKFPKSSRVLRAYGGFCEDIQKDSEKAKKFYIQADEAEEEKTKKHRNKFLFRKSEKRPKIEPSNGDPNSLKPDLPEFDVKETTSTSDDGRDIVSADTNKTNDKNNNKLSEMRAKVYRDTIQSRKSGAVRKLHISIIIVSLLVLFSFVTVYSVLRIWRGYYNEALKILDAGMDMRLQGSELILKSRQLYASALFNLSDSEIESLQSNLFDISSTFEENVHFILLRQSFIPNPKEVWGKLNDVTIFIPSVPPVKLSISINLLDLASQYRSSALILSTLNKTNYHEFPKVRAMQYILHNGLHVLFPRVNEFVEQIEIAGVHYIIQSQQIMFGLSGGVFSLLIAGILLLLIPSLRRIRVEREQVLKLFLAIPKSTIAYVNEQLVGENTIDEEDLGENAYTSISINTNTGLPIIKRLLIRFSTLCVVVVALMSAIFVVETIFTKRYGSAVTDVNHGQMRSSLTIFSLFLANELAFQDNRTWGNISEIHQFLDETLAMLNQFNDLYKYGERRGNINSPGALGQSSELNYFAFEYPCELPDGGECRGIEMMLQEFMRDGYGLSSLANENINFNNSYLARLNSMAPSLISILDKNSKTFRTFVSHKQSLFESYSSLIFALAVVATFLGYLSIRSMEVKIQEENSRTTKMLLMIPIEIIDGVAVIKEYLENGTYNNKKRWKENLEEMASRNKAGIDASADAILFTNSVGIIEYFNPAAEKFLGYLTHEILGENVKILLPDAVAVNHDEYLKRYVETRQSNMIGKVRELKVKRKGGEFVDAHVWVTVVEVGKKIWFSGCIRDISDLKKYETDLITQKELSEKVLQSILPKQIALMLQTDEGSGIEDRPIIAESYKEVSILFADVTGFNTLSTKLDASELLQTLNSLFSKWDKLCDKYGVEKIKTIGDCYMAACGVPERKIDHAEKMLDFALDLFKSLEKFNSDHENQYNLKLRVGINVGSVVAGVIGTTKIQFDIWGDAVNVASRMESTGVEGRIQVSQSAYEKLAHANEFEERGAQQVKGKGEMITHLFKERKARTRRKGADRMNSVEDVTQDANSATL